jgi:DNA helicase-2/ATP-dependent DNA helicase PcrA
MTTSLTPTQLTPEQRTIVTHRARAILIGAVAGSGKTTTLAQCVAHRERGGVPARDILVLVFTPAAEQVFRERLAQAGASRNVRVMTYADFARSLLEGWAAAGTIDGAQAYLPDAQAMRPHLYEAIEEASERLPDYDYRYDLTSEHAESIVNHLSRLKGTLDLRKFEYGDDAEIAEELDLPRGLIGVCRQYENLRSIDVGSYAFESESDYVYDVLQLADQLPEQLSWPHYGLIVADEWHDANAGHIQLLRKLADEQTQVIAAGDREQVVHSWNGADPRFMGEAFLALFPGTQRLPLSLSFRCGPTLSACAQNLSGQRFGSARIRDTEVMVAPYEGGDVADGARQAIEAVLALSRNAGDATLADVAILLRDPHQSIPIENALIGAGISYRVEGFASYFNRIEVRMLRGILHIVSGTIASVGDKAEIEPIIRALGVFASVQLSDRDWTQAARAIAEHPTDIAEFYRGQLTRVHEGREDLDESARRWRERFARVCDFLIDKAGEWSAGDLLAYAAKELQIADTTRRLFVHRIEAQAIAKSIDGFVAHARQTGLSVGDFLATLEQAQHRATQLKKSQHALTLATARDAKGKEWKHVLLPFLVNGEFPDARNEPGEERRLFYVAITRASERLVLFVPKGEHNHFVDFLRLDEARQVGAESLRDNLESAAAPAPSRIYLAVPFGEKDAAKALGAQWDGVARKWWIAPTAPTRLFKRWMADK